MQRLGKNKTKNKTRKHEQRQTASVCIQRTKEICIYQARKAMILKGNSQRTRVCPEVKSVGAETENSIEEWKGKTGNLSVSKSKGRKYQKIKVPVQESPALEEEGSWKVNYQKWRVRVPWFNKPQNAWHSRCDGHTLAPRIKYFETSQHRRGLVKPAFFPCCRVQRPFQLTFRDDLLPSKPSGAWLLSVWLLL